MKIFLALLVSLALTHTATAAEPRAADPESVPLADAPAVAKNPQEVRPNAITLEGLGRGLLWSINYDRAFASYFAVGAGFSTYSITFFGQTSTTYAIPLYFNYSPNVGNHRFQLTAGTRLILAQVITTDIFTGAVTSSAWGIGVGPFGGLGYEFRADGGFIFRLLAYLHVTGSASLPVLPWLGLSLGWAF